MQQMLLVLQLACQPIAFADSNLPLVTVDTHGREVVEEAPPDNEVIATLRIIADPSGGRNALTDPAVFQGPVKIEIRGQSSAGFEKKQYGFETRQTAVPGGPDAQVSLLGMPAEEDWILQGNHRDRSLIRNVLVYDLARKFGHYASRTAFVELFLNETGNPDIANCYAGVYVLMEKLKRDSGRINVSRVTDADVTGGYVVKIDKGDDPGFTPTISGKKIQHAYPKGADITAAQSAYLIGFFEDFEQALDGPDFEDPTSGYAAYIDTDAFVDYFIINELFKNVDAYRISTYMHKGRGQTLRMGPVWDYDLSSANSFGLGANRADGWIFDASDGPPFWWRRLAQSETFIDRVIARWKQLRAGHLSVATLFASIDALTAQLTEAQARNFTRWPILGVDWAGDPVDSPTHLGEVQELKDFLAARMIWLDENWVSLLPNTVIGRPTLLRVHDVGTGYGPPEDAINVEVVVQIDTVPGRAFGFKLRSGDEEHTHKGMLNLLRVAFQRNARLRIDYTAAGPQNAYLRRVMLWP